MMVSLMAILLSYRHVRRKWVRLTVLSQAVILLVFLTSEKNGIWADDLGLWRDSAEKSPKKTCFCYLFHRDYFGMNIGNNLTDDYTEQLWVECSRYFLSQKTSHVILKE